MYSYIYIYICENCKSERGPPRVCVLCILCSQCGARLQREIRRAALEIPRVMFAPPRVSPSSCVTRLARRSVAGPTRLRRSGHEGDAWPLPRPLRRGLRPALVYTPRLLDGWAHGWPRMGGRDLGGGGGVGGGGGGGGGGKIILNPQLQLKPSARAHGRRTTNARVESIRSCLHPS